MGVAAVMGGKSTWLGAARTFPVSWFALVVGFCALYLPTFWGLSNSLWRTDQNAHGPIVLAIAIWFVIYRIRLAIRQGAIEPTPALRSGWAVLLLGLLMYVIGRSQDVYLFEVGSLIPVLAGATLVLFGVSLLKQLWFALFFMLFMIPLPGSLIDMATLPMKIAASAGTEHVLRWLEYPIARNGVVLAIGQYQLLVADACAGLNSLFSLEALGLLYINLRAYKSVLHNVLLALIIVPISFASNLIRILALALITYHFGDAAGQGFLHWFSGIALFLTALLLVMGVDSLIGLGVGSERRRLGQAA